MKLRIMLFTIFILCISCGIIIEFVNDEIEEIQLEIVKEHEFLLKRHIHQLFGLCKECH